MEPHQLQHDVEVDRVAVGAVVGDRLGVRRRDVDVDGADAQRVFIRKVIYGLAAREVVAVEDLVAEYQYYRQSASKS